MAQENEQLDTENPEYTGDTINIDGKERSVYNSNGDRIAKSEQALRNFYKWLGDSKVVDEQGRPLVVYHGTNAEFDTFDITKFGRTDSGLLGVGFYFSPVKFEAGTYGGNIMPVYLKMKNPLYVSNIDKKTYDLILEKAKNKSPEANISVSNFFANDGYYKDAIIQLSMSNPAFTKALQSLGYDGVVILFSSK